MFYLFYNVRFCTQAVRNRTNKVANAAHPLLQSEGGIYKRILCYLLLAKGEH